MIQKNIPLSIMEYFPNPKFLIPQQGLHYTVSVNRKDIDVPFKFRVSTTATLYIPLLLLLLYFNIIMHSCAVSQETALSVNVDNNSLCWETTSHTCNAAIRIICEVMPIDEGKSLCCSV